MNKFLYFSILALWAQGTRCVDPITAPVTAPASGSALVLAAKNTRQGIQSVSQKFSNHYGAGAVLPAEFGLITALVYNVRSCDAIDNNLRGGALLGLISGIELVRDGGKSVPFLVGGYLFGFFVAYISHAIADRIARLIYTRHNGLDVREHHA